MARIEEYFVIVTDSEGKAHGVFGPFNNYEHAVDKADEWQYSVVAVKMQYQKNQWGAPKKYAGVSYPAPLDDYADGDEG